MLDILVNNAGIVGPVRPPSQTPVPDPRETYETNVFGVAVSPGSVATDQNGHRGVLTPDQGARLPIRMATLPADGPTGTASTAATALLSIHSPGSGTANRALRRTKQGIAVSQTGTHVPGAGTQVPGAGTRVPILVRIILTSAEGAHTTGQTLRVSGGLAMS